MTVELNAYLQSLFAIGSAVLPGLTATSVARPVLWATVLAGLAVLLAARLARPYRLVLAGAIFCWSLVPGQASPTYWLGLALGSPSLMSAMISLGWLIRSLRVPRQPPVGSMTLTVVGIVLGWVLLLDTLALFPVSLYALGFSPLAVALVGLVAGLIWVVQATAGSALAFLVLVVFVLSRLPTGNVWDAMLDPWLWAMLQTVCLVNAARHLRQRRSLATTRA